MSEADAASGAPGRLALDSTKRLSPQIARRIREMIMRGELSGQSALRTEHLAARFGVSATPVREALMSLSGEGLVEFRPGRGFRVTPMSRQDLIDIYDAQAYFAGELAGRAALHLTDQDIEQLYAMQQAIVAAIDRGDAEAERIEWDLHALINRNARADKLSWLLRSAVRYAPFRTWSSVTGWSEAAPEDHLPLLRGLSHRSPRTARDAMTAHIRNVGELLANHLTERGILVEDPTPVTETRSRIEGIPGPWPLDRHAERPPVVAAAWHGSGINAPWSARVDSAAVSPTGPARARAGRRRPDERGGAQADDAGEVSGG